MNIQLHHTPPADQDGMPNIEHGLEIKVIVHGNLEQKGKRGTKHLNKTNTGPSKFCPVDKGLFFQIT